MSIFKEVVEGRIEDLSERLTRHIQHTNAEAREFIKTCIKLPTHVGYQNIKVILEKWQGDPHRINASYRKETKN